MLLLTSSLSRGARPTIALAAGITTAKVVLLVFSFFGLNALLAAAPQVFDLLKFAGALFLLWRAFKSWRASAISQSQSKHGFWSSFAMAFTIAVSNPQALLFYIAVVPQVALETNLVVLCLIIMVGFTLISAFYILLAKPISTWITGGTNQRLLNKSIAIVYVCLAALVLVR
jgi:threonine/homoserine/homoserine lactone efflux protein